MKTKKLLSSNSLKYLVLFGVLIFGMSSCDLFSDYMKDKTFLTSDDIMIDEYIEKKDTSMSLFLDAADKVSFRGLLHAYGTNTCFIPNNQAIKNYCQTLGIASLTALPDSEIEAFIKFHLVRDTIRTAEFVDGRLAKATMLGKYLTTKTVQVGNENPVIKVNRQANVLEKDIRVSNGIIHKIDQVLIPNKKTVGEMVEQLPANYSLFKDIMAETGMIDTLKKNGADLWYTVILQSDESFAAEGILTKDSLINKMKIAQPDFASDPAKLLELYAQYHVISRLAYVVDLSLSSAELTLAKNQVITIKVSKDSLILNEYQSMTTFEKGVEVDKNSEWTDMSCFNGVMIDLKGYIQPQKRSAEAIYWEITDQPEIKKLKEYRKPGYGATFKPGELSELNFGGKNNPTMTYWCNASWDEKSQYVHNDYFEIPMRPTLLQWMEVKTPVLPEGVYYVWVCWRRGGDNNKFKTTFKQEGYEDQVLPNVFDLGEYFNTSATPEVNLNNGMKQYNAKRKNSVVCSRNCGAIKVEYTGRHTLRMDALSGNSQAAWWDMIQFIPVDQNQLWPRFDGKGNKIWPCTPCELIYPYDQSCSGDLCN